jgi:diketogulonate reductase-like aldo/keto reductase
MASPDIPTAAATLPSGASMPLLGFGTWQITGSTATTATAAALDAGYRHIDTATVYGNEAEVGRALADADRDGIFVTTKLPPDRRGRELETLHQSLDKLGTPYVDLWLIHWPGDDVGIDLWERFIEAREQGLTRDIGVSNYSLDQVDELERATGVKPAVNQIEWSPLLFDRAVVDGHRERGLVLEGYSALRGGTLDHPVITGIADRLGRTAAQVIVRWHLQHDTVVIPKSVHPERITANADVGGFVLSEDDMAALDALSG